MRGLGALSQPQEGGPGRQDDLFRAVGGSEAEGRMPSWAHKAFGSRAPNILEPQNWMSLGPKVKVLVVLSDCCLVCRSRASVKRGSRIPLGSAREVLLLKVLRLLGLLQVS